MAADDPIEIHDTRKRNFFMIDNVIIDHYAPIIGPFATLTYAALCRHADCSTRETHPSHACLAKELVISVASIKRAIRVLIEHRLIGKTRRISNNGSLDTNIYIILEPWGRVSETLGVGSVGPMGRVSETLGSEPEMLTDGNVSLGVGSVGPMGRVSETLGVGSVGPGVGSVGPGVGSVGPINNTQLQDLKKTKDKEKEKEKSSPTESSKRKRKIAMSDDMAPSHGEESVPADRRRGTRLPEGWQPTDADQAWFTDKGYHTLLDVSDATEEFCKYWWSRTKENTKLNWSMTWQNRMQELAKREQDHRARGYGRSPAILDHSPESQARLLDWAARYDKGETW